MIGQPGPVVLYADSWCVAVDKPSGMPSVPARNPLDAACVAVRLRDTFGPLEAVHRLDRDTSGVLLLARHREARVQLGRMFEQGLVAKRYLAVCCGIPREEAGDIHLPLAPDWERRPRQRVDPIHGRRSQTRWHLLATDIAAGAPRSLIALEPLTGRSHQLRVHLAWMGLPIVGDPLYQRQPPAVTTRLALYAAWLRVPHPQHGRPLVLHAACDLQAMSSLLGTAAAAWLADQPEATPGRKADARTLDQ